MAGQQTLNLYVVVRLHCPQPASQRTVMNWRFFLFFGQGAEIGAGSEISNTYSGRSRCLGEIIKIDGFKKKNPACIFLSRVGMHSFLIFMAII